VPNDARVLSWSVVEAGGAAGAVEIRILVALEDDYRAYREVIAAGIRVGYPRAEVTTSALVALEEEVRRFDPHVVICNLPAGCCEDRIGWVELSLHPTQPAVVCIDGHYSKRDNLTIEVLLQVLDEVEQLIRANRAFRIL
jgi:hypothetical protein